MLHAIASLIWTCAFLIGAASIAASLYTNRAAIVRALTRKGR